MYYCSALPLFSPFRKENSILEIDRSSLYGWEQKVLIQLKASESRGSKFQFYFSSIFPWTCDLSQQMNMFKRSITLMARNVLCIKFEFHSIPTRIELRFNF